LGDGPGRSLSDHGARVPEVLPAAELEGFLTGLTIAMPREPVCPYERYVALYAADPSAYDGAVIY